jgi:hypothetical protein
MIGPSKSQSDDFVVSLFEKLLLDLATRYLSEQKSFARDAVTIRARTASEGISFLTKTLPKLGKAFDLSLEMHSFDIPVEFKKLKGDMNIPVFLQGLFKECVRSDGSWNPLPGVVKDIRQVCFLAYKLELPYSDEDEKRVIDSFLSTEAEISNRQLTADLPLITETRLIIEEVLRDFDPREITPRHGPGAVATGEKLEQKWKFSRLFNAIHQEFPYYSYFIAGGAQELSDRFDWYLNLERQIAGQAKVVLVPKDSRGPRLISCEPLEYQWIQQGVGRSLMRHLEANYLTHGRVNFIDQSINANLARESSLTQDFATLDMKDASDRVSLDHIDLLFPERVRRALLAVRSVATQLPDGSVVPLHKHAPMGSALCFPVEALVFWAICVAAIRQTRDLTVKQAARLVYVYGDDIIVPTAYFESAVESLNSFNLLVNVSKSFKNGFFRESCGMDAYKGVPVTPTRLRTVWSGKPGDGIAFTSYVETANSFSRNGYSQTAQFLFKTVESTYGRLPWGSPDAGYPCRNCHSGYKALILNIELGLPIRWNAHTNVPEVKAVFLRGKKRASTLDGWPRVLRGITSHITRDPSTVAVPRSAKLVRKWLPIS